MSEILLSELGRYRGPVVDPTVDELLTAVNMYQSIGFDLPSTISRNDFFSAVSYPFLANETPPADLLKSLTASEQTYFAEEVQPALGYGVEAQIPAAVAFAKQIGSVLGANGQEGSLCLFAPPVNIRPKVIEADQKQAIHTIDSGDGPGLVIDYGMGANGIYTHLDNIKKERYAVAAIQLGLGEVAVLEGVRNYHGVTNEQMVISAGGITRQVDRILDGGGAGQADLIIASRVHMAGDDLRHGIEFSEDLLRPGGLLVARGPRQCPEYVGYDEVADMIEDDGGFDIISNYTFVQHSSHDEIESNRSIIAQKPF